MPFRETKRYRSSGITRREFIRIGGTGLAAAAIPGIHGCTRPEKGTVSLTFTCAPDDSGTLRPLINAFNEKQKGKIHVTWREMPRESDRYYRQLASEFKEKTADADVIAADAVWTAPLAGKGRVKDLSGWFHDAFDPQDFLEAPLRSAAYRLQIWGVPWYTDAGILFYRRDLLEKAGFSAPPVTWEELKQMARSVMADRKIPFGFVFQGADYEGGAANALEYIWNAGGRVMTLNLSVMGEVGQNVMNPNIITVNSRESIRGMEIARSMVADGIAPETVSNFREVDCWKAFLAGEAVFMRNWPNVYTMLSDTDRSQIRPEQVGVAPIPYAAGQKRSYSCLGGWNLMINARSGARKQEAAWEFIRYLTAPEQQRVRAVKGGFSPALRSLYDDPAFLERVPAVALGHQALLNARVRPVSPAYMLMSRRIARTLQSVLTSAMPPEVAVRNLAEELRLIMKDFRQVKL